MEFHSSYRDLLVDSYINAVVGSGHLGSFWVEPFAFRAILSAVFASRSWSRDPKNVVEFAQVQAHCKGLNWFNNCGGVPLAQQSLWTNSQACFIQSEEKVNTFIKGLGKTWISHSNATKCMRYNYAKCIFFILSTPYLCGYITHLCERIVLNYKRFGLIIHWNIAGMEDGTHRTRCEQGPILGSARRRLETEWRSWCTGGRFEWRNSQFSFSDGNMLSSQHIRLQREEGDRERETLGVRARRAGLFTERNVQFQPVIH